MSRTSSEINEEIAVKISKFKEIFVPYPPHVHLHAECDLLRKLNRELRGKPQYGLRVLAPTGSGKSTTAGSYIAYVEKTTPRTADYIPVIKIDLERHMTSKKLMVLILQAFGDPFPNYGNELMLKKRVIACFVRFRTELLIVDEVQHLNYRSGSKNDVTDTLKGLLDTGVVSIVFLGTEEAEKMFNRNLQLNGRLRPPCDLKPLVAKKAKDQKLFAGFVSYLDKALVDTGVLPQLSGLNDPKILASLFEVSSGVVGRVVRLLHVALEAAIRRGGSQIDIADLSWAVDAWAVEQGFVKKNPFRDGRFA